MLRRSAFFVSRVLLPAVVALSLAACSGGGLSSGVPSVAVGQQGGAPAVPQAAIAQNAALPAASGTSSLGSSAAAAPAVRADAAAAVPTLSKISATFAYANGTITATNTSGHDQSLADMQLTFTDPDQITSFWGSPWMNWQVATSGTAYTLSGGTPYSVWKSGGTLTVSFTVPWNSKNVPSNEQIFAVAPPALAPLTVSASESSGTITLANTSGHPIALRSLELTFTYAGSISSVWGSPWIAWTIARSGNAYTLTGGTNDATQLAAGSSMTVQFTPAAGASATAIALQGAYADGGSPAPSTAPSASPSNAPSPSPKPSIAPTPTPAPTALPTAPPPGSRQFVGFWLSWEYNPAVPSGFTQINAIPATVTNVDVAFSIADDNTIGDPQIQPGAAPAQAYAASIAAYHAKGGKVLLSFGGSTSTFSITNTTTFIANLTAYIEAHPGLYDGFDFDDEQMASLTNPANAAIPSGPSAGQQRLIDVINATRAAFPNAIISMDAWPSGADPSVALSTHRGEDIAVLQNAGSALSYVNVMDYNLGGWKPTLHPNCQVGGSDDCYEDIMGDYAKVISPSKLVLGLEIPQDDLGQAVPTSAAASYASWVKNNGLLRRDGLVALRRSDRRIRQRNRQQSALIRPGSPFPARRRAPRGLASRQAPSPESCSARHVPQSPHVVRWR